ncbi:related to aspartic proteinase precursor [Rhynchosporium graminicola]|uniref:Related to aspartic proteinase n=1 Tax=Rhynchosporium graminicola TaxID=2792576 RepID=A0A1E1JZN1_9HELO|nr:related to aspartic proteinase precursor [Rhynchosporium commune]
MLFNTLLIVAAAVSLVSAAAVERERLAVVPLKRKSNASSLKSLIRQGQNRLAQINGLSSLDTSLVSSGVVTNMDTYYTASVTIGGKDWDLIMDTGCKPKPAEASNTWCGAREPYEKTATGISTGRDFFLRYGSATVSGTEYLEKVSFGGLTVNSQSIAAASNSTGVDADGIFGLGPVRLTRGSVAGRDDVPTFMNNLKAQGSIKTEVFGISFRPESGNHTKDANGELTLGGIDASKFTGPLTYFPRLTKGDGAYFWGINVTKFTYGTTVLSSDISMGIVDTGTVITWIPTPAFEAFLSITGAQFESRNRVPEWTRRPTANFSITFGSTTYTLTPDQYLLPTDQHAVFGLDPGKYYAFLHDGGTEGYTTIIGQKFLEYYCSVYDETNSRIGFAANS